MQKVQFSALKLDRRVSWFVFCFCLFVPGEASTTEAHSSDFKSKFLVAAAKVCRSYVYNGQPLRQRGVDVKGCSLLTTANLKVGGEKKKIKGQLNLLKLAVRLYGLEIMSIKIHFDICC